MFLLEREQTLVCFWSSSSELSAPRGRFPLAGTRTPALNPRRKVAVQRRLSLVAVGPRPACPAGNSGMLGVVLECCCAVASSGRATWHPGYSLLPHTATFSLMEICSLQVSEVFFTSCDLSGDYLGVFCLESRLPSLQAYLGQSSSQQKPRVSILK